MLNQSIPGFFLILDKTAQSPKRALLAAFIVMTIKFLFYPFSIEVLKPSTGGADGEHQWC